MEETSRIIFPNVDIKLRGARYHLKNMSIAYPLDRDILDDELDAFLGKTRSVFDILLVDVNKVLNLGVDLESEENSRKNFNQRLGLFLNMARDKEDGKTVKFLELLRKEKENIDKNPYYRDFLGRKGLRNRSYHSIPARANVWSIKGHLRIKVTCTAKIRVVKADGTVIEDEGENTLPESTTSHTPIEEEKSALCFIGYESESMLVTSGHVLDIVEGFVSVIKREIKAVEGTNSTAAF
jgi:hypothetical protein